MSRKVRFEVRLDPDVHQKARKLAESSGISMNQLIEGVLCWAIPQGHPGRPVPQADSPAGSQLLKSMPADQILWFGTTGSEAVESEGPGADFEDGRVIFLLDFTPSRAAYTPKVVE